MMVAVFRFLQHHLIRVTLSDLDIVRLRGIKFYIIIIIYLPLIFSHWACSR